MTIATERDRPGRSAGDPSRARAVANTAPAEQSWLNEILVGDTTHRRPRGRRRGDSSVCVKAQDTVRVARVVPGAPGWSRRLDSPLVSVLPAGY